LWYLDPNTNQKIIPYVIEPSVGVERLMYACICDQYEKQLLENNEERVVLHFPYQLAPYKVAILPLVNKLADKAKAIYQLLLDHVISVTYDNSGSIGKRYRRQDAIGTPYCITIDFETLDHDDVTIRERDSMSQKRIKIADLVSFFDNLEK